MLRLIEGSIRSEAESILQNEIKKAVSEGKKTMLIVPEQQTVIAEKEMTAILTEKASLNFEVTNFTRFANSVFRSLGGVDKEYCDSTKSALIMWRTLSELAPTLSVTDGKKEVNYGMVKRALATSGESDGLAISIEDLEAAREKTEKNSRLSRKLDDLISINALYKKLLSEKYADVGEDVAAATKMLRENTSLIEDGAFFIEGFTSFTEPQYRLVELLISHAQVTVLLDLPKSMSDSFEYTEQKLTEKRLISSAAKRDLQPTLSRVDGTKTGNPDLYELSKHFWKKTPVIDKICLQNPDSLRIFEATTPYDECDFVISDIKKKVMGGASFSDFAVIAADISSYAGILDVSAASADVPLFISKSRDVSSFEAVKLIYTAISCVTGNFSREDVISYAKCGLSSITREECDAFELYTEKWQISGRGFTDDTVWNMNPDGYSPFRSERTDEELVRLNKIRNTLITPLFELRESLSEAKTIREHAEALYSFMRSISLYEKIMARAEELYALGERDLGEESERIYKTICDALDVLCEVSGDAPADTEGFAAQLKIVFSAASVMKIPSISDSVTAASASIARLTGKKHIYLLGVNHGRFPETATTDSYFTERDKAELHELGLPYEPDMLVKEAKCLYSFTKAFLYGKESVTILYSTKNADYSPARCSEIISRITALTDGTVNPAKISDIMHTELTYSPTQALLSLGKFEDSEYPTVKKALCDLGYGEDVRLAELKVENDTLNLSGEVSKLIYKNDIELSQSKIDKYNTCPLAYFCRYNLELSENEQAEFNARNIGSFIHSILENFFAMQRESKKELAELTREEKDSMINESAKKYVDSVLTEQSDENVRSALLIKRLIKAATPIVDGLCEEFAGSSFIPKYFEMKIGGNDELSPEILTITDDDGNRTLIKGSIDRVDTYKFGEDVYVRVVDYKTGQKDFSPKDLEKGKNLQMFLYLCAVIDTKKDTLLKDLGVGENGRLIPAGVIYVKSDLSDIKIEHDSAEDEAEAIKGDQKRQGMLLDDAVSISAMHKKYLPIRTKNDGSYYKDSEELVFSEQGWEILRSTVENSVKRVTKKMRSGNISAEPMIEKRASPCGYCKYKSFCRNAKI